MVARQIHVRLILLATAGALMSIGCVAFLGYSVVKQIKFNSATSPRQVMKSLEIAIKSYKTEYLRVPKSAVADSIPIESKGRLIAILTAEIAERNPRHIRFYDPPILQDNNAGAGKNAAGEWELRDRWGHFFRVLLDVDEDGKIPNPARGTMEGEPDTLTADVLIYSAGSDGDFATWKDNVRSWE